MSPLCMTCDGNSPQKSRNASRRTCVGGRTSGLAPSTRGPFRAGHGGGIVSGKSAHSVVDSIHVHVPSQGDTISMNDVALLQAWRNG